MEKEESLLTVLSRLSFSIEEAMREKRVVEKELSDTKNRMKMLTEANDALMKHVACLEKRNEIVVNGLLKIVQNVERNCQKMKERALEVVEAASTEEDSMKVKRKVLGTADVGGSMGNSTSDSDAISPVVMEEPQSRTALQEILPDEEPQSAELRSLVEHPVDPLVYSSIMDYSAEPDTLSRYGHTISGRLRSGRLRNGRLRSSGSLFRRRRATDSYGDSSRNVENRRLRRSGSVRPDAGTVPIPDKECGCFLQSVFGYRR